MKRRLRECNLDEARQEEELHASKHYLPRLSPPRLLDLLARSISWPYRHIGADHRADLADLSTDPFAILSRPRGTLPGFTAGAVFRLRRRRGRSHGPKNHFCPDPNFFRRDGAVSRRDASSRAHSGMASPAGLRPHRLSGFVRATGAPVDPTSSRATRRSAQRRHALSNGFQWLDAVRTFDRRFADSSDRYQGLFLPRHHRQSARVSHDISHPHTRHGTVGGQNQYYARHDRRSSSSRGKPRCFWRF